MPKRKLTQRRKCYFTLFPLLKTSINATLHACALPCHFFIYKEGHASAIAGNATTTHGRLSRTIRFNRLNRKNREKTHTTTLIPVGRNLTDGGCHDGGPPHQREAPPPSSDGSRRGAGWELPNGRDARSTRKHSRHAVGHSPLAARGYSFFVSLGVHGEKTPCAAFWCWKPARNLLL